MRCHAHKPKGFSLALLQWGHDFSAVEMLLLCSRIFGLKNASMGPRLFSRGNEKPEPEKAFGRTSLQWGHDFSAVEILIIIDSVGMPVLSFNGATTFQPWKF